MDFFSAIFDNEESDEENAEEEAKEEKKAEETPKPITTKSSMTLAPLTLKPTALPIVKQNQVEVSSDSSDSSIEEIEAPSKIPSSLNRLSFDEILDKSSSIYGPAIPEKLSSRPKSDANYSSNILRHIDSVMMSSLIVWNKLGNADEQFEELKQKKKHKKKKKHHKKV